MQLISDGIRDIGSRCVDRSGVSIMGVHHMPYGNNVAREGKRKRGRLLCVKPFEHCSGTKNYKRGRNAPDDRMSDGAGASTKLPVLRRALFFILFRFIARYLRESIITRYRHGCRYRFPDVIVSSHATYLIAIIAEHRHSVVRVQVRKQMPPPRFTPHFS